MNKIILIVAFLGISLPIQAQKVEDTAAEQRMARYYQSIGKSFFKEMGNTISEISIKELYDPPEFNQNSHIGRHTECMGNLYIIVSCLINTPYSRIQVKGKIPEKYFHIKIEELPSDQMLAALAARKLKKVDTTHSKTILFDGNFLAQHNAGLQAKAIKDSASFTQTMLRDLKKTYHIKVTDKMDTLDVWYLRIVDTSKIPRYSGTWKDEDRWAGSDNDSWGCVGMSLRHLCEAATWWHQILVQDETNEDGLFSLTIPKQAFETMERLNLFLTQNYGLRFFKRRQLEPIKLIEFEE